MKARKVEQEKYRQIYRTKLNYVCKGRRLPQTMEDIKTIPCRGSYLDAGCGTQQMLNFARQVGFSPVIGFDYASQNPDIIAEVRAFPVKDKSFDVAVMFDVLEHLIPGDDEAACKELARVSRKYILVSANNQPSIWCGWDLHINKKDYGEWEKLFKAWFPGQLRLLPGHHTSPMWRVDL